MAVILVVEDNRDMCMALADALMMEQHDVVCAPNGRAALTLLADMPHAPHVIITDLYMPEMDGIAFLQVLRDTAQWRHIPVAIMSGKTSDDQCAMEQGANAYIRKPFQFSELYDTVDRLIAEVQ